MTAGGDKSAGSLPGLRTGGSAKTRKTGRRTMRHGSAGARPAGYPLGQFDPGRGAFGGGGLRHLPTPSAAAMARVRVAPCRDLLAERARTRAAVRDRAAF